MNTPPIGLCISPQATKVLAEGLAQQLDGRLEEVIASYKEATPEPRFQSDVEQCYQWICEELHRHFKPRTVDRLRNGITAMSYWELEAQRYRDAANKQQWQGVLDAYGLGCAPTADGWRNVANYYRDVLKEHGLSARQVKDVRLSIEDQKYWQSEAELLEPISNLREHELKSTG